MIAADGAVVWFWERDSIVVDDTGRPRFSQGVMVDITARKLTEARLQEAESALREERDRAQAVLEVAGAILVVLDPDGRVLMLNQHGREVLEDPDGTLVGQEWFIEAIPEDERTAMIEMFAQLTSRSGERFVRHENDVLTRSGERRRIAWQNTVLRDPEGTIVATLSSGQDLTDRLRAEEKVAAAGVPRSAHRPAQPRPARRRLRAAVVRARRRGRAVGAAVHRPRQLQARQRLARPRGGRPAAAPRRAAPARLPASRRPARPPRRRRVPDPARRPARAWPRRPPRAAADDVAGGWPSRSRSPAPTFQRGGQRRHLAVPGRRDGPDSCSSTPTPRCTRARAAARGLDGVRADDPRPAQGCRSPRGCGGRSSTTSWSCTTSRSCGRRAGGCTRWRRCCAGTTPSEASCTPTASSRRPRR